MNRLVRVLDWVVLAALTIALGWWLTTRSTGTDAAAGPVVQTVVLIAVILAVATLASATWRAARRSWTHVAAGSKLVWRRLDAHKSEQALALGLLGAAPAVDLPLLHDLAPNAPAAQTEHDTASTGVTSTSDRGDPSSPAAISPSAGKIAPGADDEAPGNIHSRGLLLEAVDDLSCVMNNPKRNPSRPPLDRGGATQAGPDQSPSPVKGRAGEGFK